MEEEVRFQGKVVQDYSAMVVLNRVFAKTTQKWRCRVLRIAYIIVGIWCLYAGLAIMDVLMRIQAHWYQIVLDYVAIACGVLYFVRGTFFFQISGVVTMLRPGRAARRAERTIKFANTVVTFGNQETRGSYAYSVFIGVYRWDKYVVFLLDKNFGVVMDENTITGGAPAEFFAFLNEKTGLCEKTLH